MSDRPAGGRPTTTGSVTRRQAAAILGVSEMRVRRLEGRSLAPVCGPDGVWRFDVDEVLALAGKGVHAAEQLPEGELAAAAFQLFEQGRSEREVVVALKQPPRVVHGLKAEHEAMGGGLQLTGACLDGVRGLLGLTTGALSADDMLSAMKDRLRLQYQLGFRDGAIDGDDLGEVVDPETGESRRLTPETADQAMRSARDLWHNTGTENAVDALAAAATTPPGGRPPVGRQRSGGAHPERSS
jgi:hypothetical protein